MINDEKLTASLWHGHLAPATEKVFFSGDTIKVRKDCPSHRERLWCSVTHAPCKIKLCGLKTVAAVRRAVELDVAAIGFVLTDSPRQISPAQCADLRALVPEKITTHGVYANADPAFIRETMTACNLDVAQIHGAETLPNNAADFWNRLADIRAIRAFRVRGTETLADLQNVRGETFLLDAYVPGVAGGTGKTFDWKLARAASEFGRVILAGGLTADNVASAINTARPWMVDVSGGIESAPGLKDLCRMEKFVAAARAT